MNFSLRYVLITSFIIIKTVIKHLKQAEIRCFGWCIKRYCVKQRCNHKIKKTFKIIVFKETIFVKRVKLSSSYVPAWWIFAVFLYSCNGAFRFYVKI